jgi:hypothetical protein
LKALVFDMHKAKTHGWKLPQDAVTSPYGRHWRDNQRSATIKRAADAVIWPPHTPSPVVSKFLRQLVIFNDWTL